MRSCKTTRISRTILSVFVLIALIAFSSASAFASTASNATIRNTVTVDYDDTAGNAQTAVTASADVIVNLVAATPTLDAPTDQTTGPGTDAVYTYTITSNANGPDTYDLSEDSLTESAGIGGSTSSFSVPSIDLGASTVATTIAISASTATDIVVPSDLANDGSVNGIAALDTVIIDGQLFTVNSVTDNGGVGTSIINVTGATAATATAGNLITEQGTFTLTVTPGTVTDNTADQDITVIISALGTNPTAATDTTVTTVTVANLSVTKVADVATASPGDTITYTITVTNNGSSNATAATVTDPVPQFTTYVASSTTLNGITVAGDGATSPLVAGLAVDDDGARAPAAVATGIIQPGNSAVVEFQVTVN